jgi:hypothetical protein
VREPFVALGSALAARRLDLEVVKEICMRVSESNSNTRVALSANIPRRKEEVKIEIDHQVILLLADAGQDTPAGEKEEANLLGEDANNGTLFERGKCVGTVRCDHDGDLVFAFPGAEHRNDRGHRVEGRAVEGHEEEDLGGGGERVEERKRLFLRSPEMKSRAQHAEITSGSVKHKVYRIKERNSASESARIPRVLAF